MYKSAASTLSKATTRFFPRAVSAVVQTVEKPEGVGATVRRSIAVRKMRNFTPFVLLDHFSLSPDGGFPDHPHRGQETITYLLQGRIDHEDFTGSKGTLEPGDLQFMTAGKGIVHAEVPRIDKSKDGDISAVEGLQLWVDLPVELKHTDPRYRDLRAKDIPVAEPSDKVSIKVISGKSHGVESTSSLAHTPTWLFDVTINPSGSLKQEIPEDFNAFLYILRGNGLVVQDEPRDPYSNLFFDTIGDGIEASLPETATEDVHFVIAAGKILDQPIVQMGPFVETSKDLAKKAYSDFKETENGFERAKHWKSEIGLKTEFKF